MPDSEPFDWRDRLEAFRRELQVPDWDSYGANPVDLKAIDAAAAFIEEGGVNPSFVAPLARGGVQVEYERDGRYLEAEVFARGVTGYLYEPNASGDTWTERHGKVRSEVLNLLREAFV